MGKILIVGIDSLDPHVLLKYKEKLPNISNMIEESPTFISKSVFPVDTIPAWMSVYTGLHPGNHGILYAYDVFDPNLSDLKKLDISHIKGQTFWDYAGQNGYKSVIVFPQLMYPTWDINGIMVSKSPIDNRVDWMKTEICIDCFPESIKGKHKIPDKLENLWGGFPGNDNLMQWANIGKSVVCRETSIGMKLCKDEKWDLFFIYYNLLDIIQHRLWRFFDENDPSYPGKTSLKGIILDYYILFDRVIGDFMKTFPDASLIVMSDHGHKSRPINTVNLNECLRANKHLELNKKNTLVINIIKKVILKTANKFKLEHFLIKLVTKNKNMTKMSKSIYSSVSLIDLSKSDAHLSNFAGIKSYPHGGIEINKDRVSDVEFEKIREELISELSSLKLNGMPLFKWITKNDDLYPGKFNKKIYPDIVFELRDGYGVGWDLNSSLYGKAYDHNVASGGHAKDATFLIKNINKTVTKNELNLVDVAPSILDMLNINWRVFNFDGNSIFE
jgi:predicted AlkP superfamily phosphohydrolase/phosphomutase